MPGVVSEPPSNHIQTQNERYALTDKNAYINILDNYADLENEMAEYRKSYTLYKEKLHEINEKLSLSFKNRIHLHITDKKRHSHST